MLFYVRTKTHTQFVYIYRKFELAKWTWYARTPTHVRVCLCVLPDCGRNQIKRMNEWIRVRKIICTQWRRTFPIHCFFVAEGENHGTCKMYVSVCIGVWKTHSRTHTDIHSRDSSKNRQFNRIEHGRELWTVLSICIHGTLYAITVRTSRKCCNSIKYK